MEKENNYSVTIEGDESVKKQMSKAIIELMKHYKYDEFGSDAEKTMYYSLMLLELLQED